MVIRCLAARLVGVTVGSTRGKGVHGWLMVSGEGEGNTSGGELQL